MVPAMIREKYEETYDKLMTKISNKINEDRQKCTFIWNKKKKVENKALYNIEYNFGFFVILFINIKNCNVPMQYNMIF